MIRLIQGALALLGMLSLGLPAGAEAAEVTYEGTRPAPEFPTGLDWLNTDRPVTLAQLKGKVVLLDFWTYCCINCMHVIPDLKRLEAKYPKELVVIGVHSAKFDNEKQSDNIRQAIKRYEIEHPVVNDKDFEVWRLFGARAWPTLVLINPNGRIIGYHSGEGVFDLLDGVIGATVKYFDARKELDRQPIRFAPQQARKPTAFFAYPGKITADEKTGRIIFSDSNHHRLIVATADGQILDVIGQGEAGLEDGDYARARFFRPQGVCLDAQGQTLYVADTENHAIRQVDLGSRKVTTLAGTGIQAQRHNVEGPGRTLAINSPWDVARVGGTLFIAMAGAHQLWALDLKTLEARAYAGTSRENLLDGPLKDAALAQPSGLASDGLKLFFADSEVSALRAADLVPTGRVETFIGKGLFEFGDVDGRYPEARLQHCLGVALHRGQVYVADTYNHKIRKVNPQTRELATFIGTGRPGAADGERLKAQLNEPNGLCFLRDKMFIADSNNHLIRSYDPESGLVSTVVFRGLDRLRKIGTNNVAARDP